MADDQYTSCEHCREDVTWDSDYCPHCGALIRMEEPVHCEHHPDRIAAGVCIMCRTPICPECMKLIHNKRFCLEHQDIEVQQDWAKVYESDDIMEAELVKGILRQEGMLAQVMNEKLNASPIPLPDVPVVRSNDRRPAKVFVPIPAFQQALDILIEWDKGKKNAEEYPQSQA